MSIKEIKLTVTNINHIRINDTEILKKKFGGIHETMIWTYTLLVILVLMIYNFNVGPLGICVFVGTLVL